MVLKIILLILMSSCNRWSYVNFVPKQPLVGPKPDAPAVQASDGLTRISSGAGHVSGTTLASDVEISTANQVLTGTNHRMEVNLNATFTR
jgi:hypothetical protein